MSDPCNTVQSVLTNILQDVMSMSVSVIKKSEIFSKDAEKLDLGSVDHIVNDMKTLFSRISVNVNAFETKLDTAVNTFKLEIEKSKKSTSPKKKLNLSLRRRGDTQDTDIDLTNSDNESANDKVVAKIVENGIKTDETDDLSDTDSEKTIQYFDVPVTSGLMEDLSDNENPKEEVEQPQNNSEDDKIDKKENQNEESSKINKHSTDSMSFVFDDIEDDDLNAEMDKLERSIDDREKVDKEQAELLDLLTKAVGESEPSSQLTTVDDCDAALKILDEECASTPSPVRRTVDSDDSDAKMSIGSYFDSDDDDWDLSQIINSVKRKKEDEESDDVDENSEEEKEAAPEIPLKEFSLSMKKIDEADDDEIERLCNLASLDKKKCMKVIKKYKKAKTERKRIRCLSSSSSSSSSVDFDFDSDTQTPDLVIDTQPLPDVEMPDVDLLADNALDLLYGADDDDVHTDSSLSMDEEEEVEEKPKKKKEIKKEEEQKEEVPKEKKKKKSPLDGVMLFTSDEEDESNDDVEEIVQCDPLESDEEKKNDDVEEDNKDFVTPNNLLNDVPTIITDSSTDDSDNDVTFVDEEPVGDSAGGKGRRNIRAILSDNELNELTQRAKNEEDERIQRLEKHSRTMDSILSQHDEFILDADVNTGEPLVTVNHTLWKKLKDHQQAGVEFMWQACYESVKILKTKPGTGCILAHCMGLGKTLQVITLIHTLFTHSETKTKHVLVVCPLSTVNNWKNEFKQTFDLLDQRPDIKLFFINKGDRTERVFQIRNWRRNGGVLVMGYEAFTTLTNEKIKLPEHDKKTVDEALLDPGADLIVCDEGHQLKNGKTLRTQALTKVKTKRRIVLTGTPLQNNLQEYYHMVQFVKPHLLGTYEEYKNRFANPITNGQHGDSSPDDIKLMKKRTHVLNKLLKKTIHRVEASVLQKHLPEIKDYTVFTRLTPLQVSLYTKYVNIISRAREDKHSTMAFFGDYMLLGFGNLHPYAIQIYYNTRKPKSRKRKRGVEFEIANLDDREHETQDIIEKDWYKELMPDDVTTNVNYSAKLKMILSSIDETVRNGEKILIFARYRVELDCLEHFFKIVRGWRPNIDYYRMDGDTPIEDRLMLCNSFNNKPTAKVFILTHKVGGLGLNLTGANRVIMIGCNYNPSLDNQSMYRVYRFGQRKECFIYRLLSLGTVEEKIYERCVVKLHLSGTVIDKLHFARPPGNSDLKEMYNINFEEFNKERPIPIVPLDKVLAVLLKNINDIYKYHLHTSLLENRPEEELTDEDKKLAWDEFNSMEEAAKQAALVPTLPPQKLPMPHTVIVQNPVIPAQQMYQFNNPRMVYHVSRNSAPNMVPNPMNNSTRGFLPRGMHNQPSTSTAPNNPFLQLFNQNKLPQNPRIMQNVRHVIENFERLKTSIPVSTVSAVQKLQNYAFNNRQRDHPRTNEAHSSGEFNYALNKVV